MAGYALKIVGGRFYLDGHYLNISQVDENYYILSTTKDVENATLYEDQKKVQQMVEVIQNVVVGDENKPKLAYNSYDLDIQFHRELNFGLNITIKPVYRIESK